MSTQSVEFLMYYSQGSSHASRNENTNAAYQDRKTKLGRNRQSGAMRTIGCSVKPGKETHLGATSRLDYKLSELKSL